MADPEYPAWVCSDCGDAHGRRECRMATFHVGTCCICGREDMVTEPRDYGHLKDSWKAAASSGGGNGQARG